MNSGLFISDHAFRALPPDVQKTLLAVLTDSVGASDEPPIDDLDVSQDDDEPAALNGKQARKLLDGCGGKTKNALRLLSETPGGFSLEELAARMELEPQQLKNVWSGLTKRVRTVTGSDTAVLIEWDEVGGGADWRGRLHQDTRAALAELFAPKD